MQLEKYSVRYEGVAIGRPVKSLYVKKKEDQSTARGLINSAGDEKIEALMVSSEPLREIRVYEKPETT